MNRNHAPEPARNSYGFPLADAPAYLPRERARDIPLPITMEEPAADMSKAVVIAIVILCILAFAAALSPAFWANF